MIGPLERLHGQSARFQAKLERALYVVGQALRQSRRPYIAFSGGKDSIALAGLVHTLAPDVPLAWSDDELEYPETVAYMTRLHAIAGSQLHVTLGHAEHAGWFWPWQEEPYWREPLRGSLRIAMPQDDWMAGLGYDLTFTGVRESESRKRRGWLLTVGPLYRVRTGTGWRCCPLAEWTEDDVLGWIARLGLPYNAAYDRLTAIGIARERQRVGPLPLTPRPVLAEGWPELLAALERRYGARWR